MKRTPPAAIDQGMTRTRNDTCRDRRIAAAARGPRFVGAAAEQEEAAQLAVGIRERSDGEQVPGLVQVGEMAEVGVLEGFTRALGPAPARPGS